ncbi:MAG: HU family DNA-binding protein [Desulfosarcina sp.]|nr:HU family DNA-binding protein [Desulfobacterales bacterium]
MNTRIIGFVALNLEHRSYAGRNPKTGEKVKIKLKKRPFFKAGKKLKERVDRRNQNAVSVIVRDWRLTSRRDTDLKMSLRDRTPIARLA